MTDTYNLKAIEEKTQDPQRQGRSQPRTEMRAGVQKSDGTSQKKLGTSYSRLLAGQGRAVGVDLGRQGLEVFHRPCPWGVAEAKRALLGWQKPVSELNHKNKREHCTLGKSLLGKEIKPGRKTDLVGRSDISEPSSLQLTVLGYMRKPG